MRRATFLGLMLVATIFNTAGVGAAEPVVRSGGFYDAFTTSELCGFPLQLTFEGRYTERIFFDQKTGEPVRATLHSTDVLTIFNSASGQSASGHEALMVQVDFVDATEVKVGVPIHVNVPGGAAVLDAGIIRFDASTGEVSFHGIARYSEGDLGALCSYLA